MCIFEPLGMKDTAFSAPASKLDRLATAYLTNSETGALELYDPAKGGQWSRLPAFPSGGAGLVSTADDYLAFARMMLNQGRHGGRCILSRPSVETMTVDHLTAAQKAVSGLISDNSGWGFGVAVVTRRDHVSAPVGSYGWAGGLGTSWRSDPSEDTYPIQTAVDDLQLGQGLHQPSLPPEPDEWIRRLGTLPLLHQPGEKWLYHTGSDLRATSRPTPSVEPVTSAVFPLTFSIPSLLSWLEEPDYFGLPKARSRRSLS